MESITQNEKVQARPVMDFVVGYRKQSLHAL